MSAARAPRYNPAFLSEDDLIHSFVVRSEDLAAVLEAVRENKAASNQHLLVVGPRGMGKTTLVRRAAAAVRRDPKLQKKWTPILFGEETYEVATPAELWLEAIFYLGQQTGDVAHQAAYEALKPERDEKRLYDRALGHLMDYAERSKRRLLVVVENLNMLLSEQLRADDAWVLRKTLQTEPRIMVLATAPTRFDDVDLPDRAMYELFRVHELSPLDKDECRQLWLKSTGQNLAGDQIRPVQILTGGNPRLIAILGSFADRGSLRYLMDDLNALVDEHTAYFKTNLEALPAPERKVFAVLADLWKPAGAREVAEAARLEVNLTSTYLQRLAHRGAVTPVGQVGRARRYQIAERLYNIYHLMRRSGEPSHKVRAVVDFMIGYYQPERLVDAIKRMVEEACAIGPDDRKDHLLVYEGLLHEIVDDKLRKRIVEETTKLLGLPEVSEQLRRKTKQALEGKPTAQEKKLRQKVKKAPRDGKAWLALGQYLIETKGATEDIEATLRRSAALLSKSAMPLLFLGSHLLGLAGRTRDAEEALRGAFAVDPKDSNVVVSLSIAMLSRDDALQEAEALLRGQILGGNLDPRRKGFVAEILASVLLRLERYEEAVHFSCLAPEEKELPKGIRASALLIGAKSLSHMTGREEEAEKMYESGLELLGQDALAMQYKSSYADFLFVRGRPRALDLYFQLTSQFPNEWSYWDRLASLLLKAQRVDDARDAARRALTENPDAVQAFFTLVTALGLKQTSTEELERELTALVGRSSNTKDLKPCAAICVAWSDNEQLIEAARSWSAEIYAVRPDEALVAWSRLFILFRLDAVDEAIAVLRSMSGKPSATSLNLLIAPILLWLAVRGRTAEVLEYLSVTSNTDSLWAVRVALEQEAGHEPDVPLEVALMAADIRGQLERLREHYPRGDGNLLLNFGKVWEIFKLEEADEQEQ